MEYQIKALADLVGLSTRTLRYYDEIGLLPPARLSAGGYRIYGKQEVDTLQQILFYRELGVPLAEIARLLREPHFDRTAALHSHLEQLQEERRRLDRLIQTLQRSIAAEKGGIPMQDSAKFEGFKRELIEKNEAAHGAEAREAYGDRAVDASNARLMGLSAEEYAAMERCGQEVFQHLDAAFASGDSRGTAAQKAAETHRRWLGYTWADYSPEAHAGLAEMYASDPRFSAYYDRGVAGKAAFFRDCIVAWLEIRDQD